MACRGVFFALSAPDEKKVLDAPSDDALIEVIKEDIEERWDAEWLAEVDKAWDAMHRCLGDGTLRSSPHPLSRCVLGGRQLHEGSDYIVSYLSAAEVKTVAAALAGIEKEWFARRYDMLEDTDYEGPFGSDDHEYTWEYFTRTRELFVKASRDGRAMLFTVDQ